MDGVSTGALSKLWHAGRYTCRLMTPGGTRMAARAVQARIGALIRAKRREQDVGLRDAAEACKVSPSTLSRLERGGSASLPDTQTLNRLADWLGLTLEQ